MSNHHCYHIAYKWLGDIMGHEGIGETSLITEAPASPCTASIIGSWIDRIRKKIIEHHNADAMHKERQTHDIVITSITDFGPGKFE